MGVTIKKQTIRIKLVLDDLIISQRFLKFDCSKITCF